MPAPPTIAPSPSGASITSETNPGYTSRAASDSVTFSFLTALFGVAALVYLTTTGALPFVGRDEPRYVEIGREMLQSGDWITPHLGGFTWFEKPVLLYWMVASSFGLFGVSEWAARLGPALCGLVTAALVWWMLRPTSEKWARLSALVLLSSGGMMALSHAANFDIVITACLTLALAAWWKAQIEPARASRFLALCWTGIGLAFLAKGLIAFILPLGTVGLYAFLRRERVKLKFWWGLPLALAVSLVWYGPVIWVNGERFVNIFFVQHHFQRFTSNKYKHHQPPWFYLEILPLFALPWTPFLLGALWKMRRSILPRASSVAEGTAARLKVFALAWMLVPVAFFSLSGSKLPGYILPSLPGAAILVAAALNEWTTNIRRERFVGALAVFMFVTVAIATTTAPGIARAEKDSGRHLFRVAQERGLGHLHTVAFSTTLRGAEFYGASSLVYGKDGEPLRLEKASEVRQLAQAEPILILVKDEDRKALAESGLTIKDVAQNGEISLVLARR